MTTAAAVRDELRHCDNAFVLYDPATGRRVGLFVYRGRLLGRYYKELAPWTDRSPPANRDVTGWVNNVDWAWNQIGHAGLVALSEYRNFRYRREQGNCRAPKLPMPDEHQLHLRTIVLVEPEFKSAAEAGRDMAHDLSRRAVIIPNHVAVVTSLRHPVVVAAVRETMPQLQEVFARDVADQLVELLSGMPIN